MNKSLVRQAIIEPKEEEVFESHPDFSNLERCINDAMRAALDSEMGPKDPTKYNELRGRLVACREKLPPLYRETVFDPFVSELDRLGEPGFIQILLDDPDKERAAGLMLDIAHVILQNGEGFYEMATDAFQEVVSDLYDGFLSAEDRRGVKPPDLGVIPPLVKWGRPDFGPYTWPVDATSIFGLGAAIVSLPPANARLGILAWSALGHETAGHDILHADIGLRAELANTVRDELMKGNINPILPDYWADKIDETGSDVMGILNMGPAAGIGLIGYFRGLNKAFGGDGRLSNLGKLHVYHPADILRGYLAASVIRRLFFTGAEEWAKAIEAETDKDLRTIRLGMTIISAEDAKKSADIVAEVLVNTKMKSLENHALGEIQNWRDHDEGIVEELRTLLMKLSSLPAHFAEGIYAAHVVAAAVTAALAKDADVSIIFDRMLGMLKTMHDANPSWGPLYVEHPGNLSSIRTYVPSEEEEPE
ncbi:hypothetical protein ACSAZK_01160 [Methanosarcina sp. Mfa9]|uniref:hypothetical protein n=1 Tax=Methanosarcina sp. Mfa9 TaxID=3439063 RepID=UPI003F848D0A